MQRAVVSIGVKKTGQLPELQAAIESAGQFAAWAKTAQRIPASRVKLITDAKGPVSRDRIFETVQKITELGFIEQLIVYFSGHGINSGLFEQWLLSRAPDDPAAAVNLKGSEFGARFCGIGHVVFISDACRTAADSIQAQRVAGGDIFPNAKPTGPEKPVDQFFATLVGNPAYEVKTIEESVGGFRAAYSTVLMQALRGEVPGLIEPSSGIGRIHPRPLKSHLATAVPSFFTALNLTVSARPDARIESDPEAWIAELPLAAAVAPASTAPGPKRRSRGPQPTRKPVTGEEVLPRLGVERHSAARPSLQRQGTLAFRAALGRSTAEPRRRSLREDSRSRSRPAEETDRRYSALVSSGQTAFGPDHLTSACGIKVRGGRIASVYSRHADVTVGTKDDVVAVDLKRDRRGANVLVELADGSLVVAPVFRDFITGLSFGEEGNLEDVWCEPSANTTRWREYQRTVDDVRRLRAVIAASTAFGVFRLEEAADADALLARMRQTKTIDPALAVYAAHAFSDRRMRSQIVDMQRYLDADLGVRIFDVALLAFSLGGKPSRGDPHEMYPCVPMLTQGWALLSPLGVTLPGGLGGLRGELRASLWTHFNPAAADRLRHVLSQGKVE